MWRFVQDRSHGRNGGIRSFAAFPPNIFNLMESPSALSGAPLMQQCVVAFSQGRFGYSDLKEAALTEGYVL
jgi:hypothetical protein